MRVAVIPARGGSKRIPRKNIRPFLGKPIISYSIEAAIASNLFDRVIVSTDDEEIAEVSLSAGADVPFLRPKNLADDHTGTNAVVKQAIEWFRAQNMSIEYVCCIYATAPLLQVKYLQEGFDRLAASQKSYSFSVTSFPFPIMRAIKLTSDGGVNPFFPKMSTVRSQDLEEAYHDAGQFYWGRTQAFLEDRELFSSLSIPVVMPRYLVQDIDTFEDWTRAELMCHSLAMNSETRV